jgi:hypothetical protein
VAERGLIDTINHLSRFWSADDKRLTFPSDFLTPGALVVLTSFAKSNNLAQEHLALSAATSGYASAIGLSKALWGVDDYEYGRRKEGRNYSTLEHLSNPEATDIATSRINSCIRSFVGDLLPAEFVAKLCEVVGDLHENVWAHGMASGFSMAQKWIPKRDHYLEFALADSGLGFLSEMRRVGMKVNSHREAIEWCIQEGHSTKKLKPEAIWTQRIPEDVINNPLRGVEETRITDNHHMGLGLFKLTQLIKGFRGELWLASGDTALILEPGRKIAYIMLNHEWQGVAIACRFKASQIKSAGAEESADKDIEQIMQILGERHD